MLSLRGPKGAVLCAIHVLFVGAACASGGTTDADNFSPGTSGSSSGHDAATSSGDNVDNGDGASSGVSDDSSSVGSTEAGDDASGDGATGDDSATGDDADDSAASSGASSGSGSSGSGTPAPTYTCLSSLSPAPVCDAKHDFCLCTADAQCNSAGTNIGNKGGCHNSNHCSGGACTGGQFADSAGCSVVSPFCNLGNANACPTGTTCEVNHGDCGGSVQCCWCTSDSACPVGGKCIDDPTQKQCMGGGPCTGSGTNWDGMHCQLGSPGLPMCTAVAPANDE
jgi:hypothetical protein